MDNSNTRKTNKINKESVAEKKVAIIGLGLIGGSIARSLKLRIGIGSIIAVDNDEASLRMAEEDGIITKGFPYITDDVFSSDIIFLCTPVKKSLEYLQMLASKVKESCIITDAGSTKNELAEYINSLDNAPCFIGGHPMTGSEKSGYSAGSAHIFENAYYILTPCKSSGEQAVRLIESIVEGMGAIPVIMDPAEHDRVLGAISHLPHVAAAALVNLAIGPDAGGNMARLLAAGGFRDITRIASSSPEMWENILLSNKECISKLIDEYIQILVDCKSAMNTDSSEDLLKFFRTAKACRDTLPPVSTGLIQPEFHLTVDVVDRPGIIGEIATILGRNNINIKNINVANSGEFEQGCLRITFSDYESTNIGFDLLRDSGYKVYK